MSPQETLAALDAEVETRVAAIRADHPDWLCGKGCDACCRRLATLPQLTPPEAERLRAAFAALALLLAGLGWRLNRRRWPTPTTAIPPSNTNSDRSAS